MIVIHVYYIRSIIITPCYNTIARNVEGLGISPFIMFSLNALTLPPSGYLQGLLQDRIGRYSY